MRHLMLAPERLENEAEGERLPETEGVLADERAFYEAYPWSLNPHLTVRQAIEHLEDEIGALPVTPRGWQSGEVVTNVYLLSCALLNSVDEYLRGASLRLPSRLAGIRAGRAARWMVENLMVNRRPRRSANVRRWRVRWLAALNEFLSVMVTEKVHDPALFAESGAKLVVLLRSQLPSELQTKHIGIPSPFRRLDLTPHDIVALGERYARQFLDRSQKILLVGLRTSGSYFAPLLRAVFAAQGYGTVSLLTLSPSKGPGSRERRELRQYAEQGYTVVIVDDPPHTGGAIFTALEIVRRIGFGRSKTRVLVPTHPARQQLFKTLPDDLIIALEPKHWHKSSLLDPETVQRRLAAYFGARNFVKTSVIDSDRVKELNAKLQNAVSDERGARLKKIFEVKLKTRQGRTETRYVLAKSVGWGWLGYHAFLAGERLSGFVPPILGLRDGILYMEWIPDSVLDGDDESRRLATHIDSIASYIAARMRHLSLAHDSIAGEGFPSQNNGMNLLRDMLSKAYGTFPANLLAQPLLGRLLRRQPCPFPTLIDGNMQQEEWIAGPRGLLKTDYEHHGLGKEELNVCDPAYDLADTILNWQLSAEDESRLVRRYIKESGDTGVEQRLPLNKLLAGFWGMKRAHDQLLGKAAVSQRQQVFHRRFMAAWDFLTVQTARHYGRRCRSKSGPRWRSPLVATDIDGVLDRRVLGFPSTTAAGIEALSLLHAYDFSVAVDTARSVSEVKAYCDAYALAGGVAEHGSYIWDAVNRRGRSLIGPEAMAQLEVLKRHLRQMPGVFLDYRHQYSVRAFSYRDKPRGLKRKLLNFIRASGVGDGVVGPVPTLLIRHLMTDLRLDLLSYHHTEIDTAIVAKDANKGTGLLALRDWVLGKMAKTIAIGDQEPDLEMFRVATRSFAPANIGCRREARLVGCRIARQSFQRGLLEIARTITRQDVRDDKRKSKETMALTRGDDLLIDVLAVADRTWSKNLWNALLDRALGRFQRGK
jgi:hydroxymethylpyrimidine pyrophosphatase-like HAD family hydrolase